MNKDFTTSIYKSVFGIEENHKDVNKFMKAVIINFGDDRGDIIVKNDNFGTNRKYADFTNGKKEAGLHPMQIVFSGVDFAKVVHERYINENDEVRVWGTEEVISDWKQIGGVLIFDESLRIMDDGEYDDEWGDFRTPEGRDHPAGCGDRHQRK